MYVSIVAEQIKIQRPVQESLQHGKQPALMATILGLSIWLLLADVESLWEGLALAYPFAFRL